MPLHAATYRCIPLHAVTHQAGIRKDGTEGASAVSQHKLALAALERKAEKVKGIQTAAAHSQHAQALSALKGGGKVAVGGGGGKADGEEIEGGSSQFAQARNRLFNEQARRFVAACNGFQCTGAPCCDGTLSRQAIALANTQ